MEKNWEGVVNHSYSRILKGVPLVPAAWILNSAQDLII